MKTVFVVQYIVSSSIVSQYYKVVLFDNREAAEAYLKYVGEHIDGLYAYKLDEWPVCHSLSEVGEEVKRE